MLYLPESRVGQIWGFRCVSPSDRRRKFCCWNVPVGLVPSGHRCSWNGAAVLGRSGDNAVSGNLSGCSAGTPIPAKVEFFDRWPEGDGIVARQRRTDCFVCRVSGAVNPVLLWLV